MVYRKTHVKCQNTEEELIDVIKAFKSGKTPGLDGGRKYTKTFFDFLRGPVIACFNHSYVNGRLSDTKQEGLISL
jgi:hypothetical protein